MEAFSSWRHLNRQTFRSCQQICGLAQTLDRRAHHCLAQSLPKARQGLGESQPKGARVLAPRLNPPHAQKTMQSGLKSSDRLSACDVASNHRNRRHLLNANGAILTFLPASKSCFQYRLPALATGYLADEAHASSPTIRK